MKQVAEDGITGPPHPLRGGGRKALVVEVVRVCFIETI